MNKNLNKKWISRFLVLIAVTIIAVVSVASVVSVNSDAADNNEAVAQSETGGVKYYSISEAWSAANSGTKIVLLQDWKINDTLHIQDSKKVTIEMNGKQISFNYNSVSANTRIFELEENSTLELLGNNKKETEFKYYGMTVSGNNLACVEDTVKSGGLVTAGYTSGSSYKHTGGIEMNANSNLTMTNVALAGNSCKSNGGGIEVSGKNCTITLNNAEVKHNACVRYGGGIYIDKTNCKVKMENSSISYNVGQDYGGAIYSNDNETTIEMTKNSKMDYNKAKGGVNDAQSGGAVYFNYGSFNLISSDRTASISYNESGHHGGAIYVEQYRTGTNGGTIDGITLEKNSADATLDKYKEEGGAIYIEQENITVSNCNILNNVSEGYGGGISINNDNCTISNCTINGNVAKQGSGGGVEVSGLVDVKFSGTLIITGNLDGNNNANDVYLGMSMTFTRAYIKGTPSVPTPKS